VVSYILVVAVANLALGFLLAASLGRRYHALESSGLQSPTSPIGMPAGLDGSEPPAGSPLAADPPGHGLAQTIEDLPGEEAAGRGQLPQADESPFSPLACQDSEAAEAVEV
jgi:hypothetical protein